MNGIRRNEISATNVTDSGERKHKEGVSCLPLFRCPLGFARMLLE